MKRRLTLILVAAILLTQLASVSSAAIKSGAVCKKLNSTVTSGGLKHTCIKSGKKLVWSKGKKVPTTSPSPSPTPTISASPSPTATISASPSPTPTISSRPVTIDNLDPTQVAGMAYDSVLKALSEKPLSKVDVKFTVDPNVPSKWMEQEAIRLDRIYSLMKNDFNPDFVRALYWLDTNAESIAWAQTQYNSWGSYIKKNLKDDVGQQTCGNASGVGWFDEVNGVKTDRWGYITCAGEVTPDKAFKAVHEYFHLFQTKFNLTGEHQVQWLVEGSADYYGQALGLIFEDPAMQLMHRKMQVNNVPGISTFTLQDFVGRMKSLESANYDARQAYYLGSLATEVLIAIYGHQKVIDFMKDWKDLPDCRRGCTLVPNNLDARFQKWFGMPVESFYEKLYPYVKAMTAVYKT